MKQLHKKKDVDLLIFDLDGTLIDSRQDLAISVNYTRKNFGLAELNLEQVMEFVGDGAPKLIERAFPGVTSQKFENALEVFKKHYQEHIFDNTVCYQGVADTLSFFSHKKKVIISNKPVVFTQQIAERLFTTQFDLVLGGDSMPQKKPSPEPILQVLEKLNISAEKAAIIGDGSPDIVSGKAAGVTTCAVTYGFRTKDFLLQYEPDYCIESFPELRDVFV